MLFQIRDVQPDCLISPLRDIVKQDPPYLILSATIACEDRTASGELEKVLEQYQEFAVWPLRKSDGTLLVNHWRMRGWIGIKHLKNEDPSLLESVGTPTETWEETPAAYSEMDLPSEGNIESLLEKYIGLASWGFIKRILALHPMESEGQEE